LEAIWKKEYSLESFTSRDQFKSYEDLERRLNLVLGIGQPVATVPTVDDEEFEPIPTPVAAAPSPVKEEAVVDDDDALSYFAKLAEE